MSSRTSTGSSWKEPAAGPSGSWPLRHKHLKPESKKCALDFVFWRLNYPFAVISKAK